MKDIKTIAEKTGRELTSKGNLEIGSDDQGSHGTPGQQAHNAAVSYYLLSGGDYRVVIDDRYGSNQGRIEWQGGDITRLDGADLDEVIGLAKDHIDSLEDGDELMRAWRIASSEARATMRAAEREEEDTLSLTITVPRTEANARAMIDSLIRLERDMRSATKEIKPGNTTADDLAAQRRQLQEEMGLVLTHDQIDEIARENKAS